MVIKIKKINKYISIKDKLDAGVVELDIFGDIVDKQMWDEDITPKLIKDELRAYEKAKTLEIHVNSDGGSVSAGNGIISIVDTFRRKTGCTVEAYVEGICASMATGIIMCADKIYMADNALMLIHKPLMDVCGNANDLQNAIAYLDKAQSTLVKNYMRHWKGTEEELINALEETTIYTAEEALEAGLCDEIIQGVQIAASAKGITIGSQNFGTKVFDLIKNKYPQIKVEKEETKLEYDVKLKDYGISNELFNSVGIDSERVMQIVNAVKSVSGMATSVEQFVNKEKAVEMLGVTDITADEIINYAKIGMNAPDVTEIQNKADKYERVVKCARDEAMASAVKAKGDMFNEARVRKMLDALDYEDIIDQTKEWNEEAKLALHAGKRVSMPAENLSNAANTTINAEDYNI